jgi:O-acetylhomoserine/O-acetylserine sulfhydrylase-like pyridoxal-dependent enzyme
MSNSKKKLSGFSSVAIHGGHTNDPMYAHLTPIYASSTYTFDTAEHIFIADGATQQLPKPRIKYRH